MAVRRVVMLGGAGFVGRAIVAQLVAAGHQVTVLTRHRERHRELLVHPTLTLLERDIHNVEILKREFAGQDAAINLVGILNERGRSGAGFERAHAELATKVVEACRAAKVPRLLHMSALNAAPEGASHYLRSKGRAEQIVHAADCATLHVTSFRPSVIFGEGDSFTNRFARLLRLTPLVFPLACPSSRLQPVYVEDVARAFAFALDSHHTFGQRYELCGPRVYTLAELVTLIGRLAGAERHVLKLSPSLSKLQAMLLEFVPGKPFSLDNYRSLTFDSICRRGLPTFFGITPTPLETAAPAWLRPAR